MITVHTIVKNEENYIWFAIKSVIDQVDKIIIFDTGSKDRTVEIIKSINSPKIELFEKGEVNPSELTKLRQEQVEMTRSEWFLLLDGDEVWPKDSIKKLINTLKSSDIEKMGVVVRSRNCVGDIFHYLPENRGKYNIMNIEGHLNIRAYKKSQDFKWSGVYPLESYSNLKGPINHQDDKLIFLDVYYWHLTHLKRSSINNDFKKHKRKLEIGIKANTNQVPEVFFEERPDIVPSPSFKLTVTDQLIASIMTLIKEMKYKL